MSKVRIFFRENPLARMVRGAGGVRFEEAVAQAHANLDSIREDCIAAVDTDIARLDLLLDRAMHRPDPVALSEAYQRSNAIAGVAGSCGMAELGEAAFSLCELLDRIMHSEGWNAQAAAVHLNAIKLLRSMAGAASGGPGRAVLDGLREVAVHAGIQS